MTTSKILLVAVLGIGSGGLVGCQTDPPKTAADQHALKDESHAALDKMYQRDSSLRAFIENAYAYAVFPSVGKGGVIVGGASGRGEVFEQGRFIGYAQINQVTAGAQIGGQEYSEVIVFQNSVTFDRFRDNQTTFTADAAAVAVKAGASSEAHFKNGVAVFTLPTGGLMVEASIGGQKFTFDPASEQAIRTYNAQNNHGHMRHHTETSTETQTSQ